MDMNTILNKSVVFNCRPTLFHDSDSMCMQKYKILKVINDFRIVPTAIIQIQLHIKLKNRLRALYCSIRLVAL